MKKGLMVVGAGLAVGLMGCAERRVVYTPPPTTQVITTPAPQVYPTQQPSVIYQVQPGPAGQQKQTTTGLPGTPQANGSQVVQPEPQVVQVAPPPPQQQPRVVVQQTPPAPQVEMIPVNPGPEYVWAPGYWAWNGGWVWIGGRWSARPHPHAVWIGGRWERHGHGYVWRGGRWR